MEVRKYHILKEVGTRIFVETKEVQGCMIDVPFIEVGWSVVKDTGDPHVDKILKVQIQSLP